MVKHTTIYIVTIFCILFIAFSSYAQINLIKNPSFEQYNTCPNGDLNIYNANMWYAIDNNISDTDECNGIYFNVCANSIMGDYDGVPGPGAYLNYQYPKSGDAYIGILLNC